MHGTAGSAARLCRLRGLRQALYQAGEVLDSRVDLAVLACGVAGVDALEDDRQLPVIGVVERLGSTAPESPFAPACPAGPAGNWPAAKSNACSEPGLTLAPVTAFRAAQPRRPSASTSGMAAPFHAIRAPSREVD
jgi:hypothetical protein